MNSDSDSESDFNSDIAPGEPLHCQSQESSSHDQSQASPDQLEQLDEEGWFPSSSCQHIKQWTEQCYSVRLLPRQKTKPELFQPADRFMQPFSFQTSLKSTIWDSSMRLLFLVSLLLTPWLLDWFTTRLGSSTLGIWTILLPLELQTKLFRQAFLANASNYDLAYRYLPSCSK